MAPPVRRTWQPRPKPSASEGSSSRQPRRRNPTTGRPAASQNRQTARPRAAASSVQNINRSRGQGHVTALGNTNNAAIPFGVPEGSQYHPSHVGYRTNGNRNTAPGVVYMPTPQGADNGLGENESLATAQELGPVWVGASGYDGPYLPEPSLISAWGDETLTDPFGILRNFERNYEPDWRMLNPYRAAVPPELGDFWTDYEVFLWCGRSRMREEHDLQLRRSGSLNSLLPSLPRIVGGIPGNEYVLNESRVLPSMGLFLAWTVGDLPALSQPYYAYHLNISHRHRNGHTDPVHRSPVHNDSPFLGVPFGSLYTQRTSRKNRFLNMGPTNGFRSFGDLIQADMTSCSIEHFSIMANNQNTAAVNQQQRDTNAPRRNFNIFQELVQRPELVIIFAKHLRVQELLILYSLSKPFKNIVSSRITTVIISQALTRAPDSARTFPFRCYQKLCIPDPGLRLHPVSARAMAGELRKVPSFRWLRMVCYREMVCHEIMTIMAEDGVPMAPQCEPVLKKIWLLMDIPDNMRRIGLVQNSQIFTDEDLFFALLFFVKMDMRFTDPITGSGKDGMRRLMMAQPGLTVFWKTLKRTMLKCKMDVIKLYVRWKYEPTAMERGRTIFGVPPEQVGIMRYEGWGETRSRVELKRPDELLLMESLRRGLNLEESYTDMFLWGYVNPNTLEDIPPQVQRRPLERLEGMEEILVRSQERADIFKRVSTRVLRA